MKDVILVGGGGFCKSVADVIEDAGYNILGILDKSEEVGRNLLNYQIIGTFEDIPAVIEVETEDDNVVSSSSFIYSSF